MPRRRRRSYAPSLSATPPRKSGTPTARSSIGIDAPDDLRAAFDRGATFAAWNASFDAAVWNYCTLGFPFLAPERVIDVMVQAGVSNLPTDLESASRVPRRRGQAERRQEADQAVLRRGRGAPRIIPRNGSAFSPMRARTSRRCATSIARTRPLPLEEWRAILGVSSTSIGAASRVDLPFVERAAALAAEDGVASGRRLAELTGGTVPGHAGEAARGLAARSAPRCGDARRADGRRARRRG